MIIQGDALTVLGGMKPQSVQTCITSPPYWGLRDYGIDGQLGLEETPGQYVEKMVEIFREVRRALRDDGTLWLNLGDAYAANRKNQVKDNITRDVGNYLPMTVPPGLKPKNLIGIPWRVAFALQADGWYLRCDIIWAKPNPMPESVKDRPTKAHEYIFLMSKNQRYYYDADAIREPHQESSIIRDQAGYGAAFRGRHTMPGENRPHSDDHDGFNHPDGRNKRSVWTIPTKPFPGAHFAVFPPKLIEPCILAGCPEGGIVLDPFFGSGITGLVSKNCARKFIGIEINEDYIKIAKKRLSQGVLF